MSADPVASLLAYIPTVTALDDVVKATTNSVITPLVRSFAIPQRCHPELAHRCFARRLWQLAQTAAVIAARHGKLDLLQYMIENHAVDARGCRGTEVCGICLVPIDEHDDDEYATGHSIVDGCALIHAASYGGHILLITWLLGKGASVTDIDCVSGFLLFKMTLRVVVPLILIRLFSFAL